ncbi:MAG: hypothetical protein NVS3B18_11530 [Candidatus Dormibacteria bacterium]
MREPVLMTFSLDRARSYIAGVRWQFATTMPQWPHEYTVRHWRPELDVDFAAFASFIRAHGTVKPWPAEAVTPRHHNTYLEVDGWEYWTMGEPIAETTVINRARLVVGEGQSGTLETGDRGAEGQAAADRMEAEALVRYRAFRTAFGACWGRPGG